MDTKTIKAKLQSGKPTIGSWMQIPNASVAEIMGNSGYDWVAIDLEHGSFSLEILPDIFRALQLGGTVPFARVAQNHPKDIKQALDAGARGIIVPMVETGEDIVNMASWAKYPPGGTRGVGFSRTNLFGKNFSGYVKNINDEIILVAQIEHINAVNNMDKILGKNLIDAVIVGPYDLSGSMNLTAQFDHPQFLQAMEQIRLKTKEYNVPMGLHIVQPDQSALQQKIAEGYQFIAYSIDSVFMYNAFEAPKITNL